MEEIKMHTKFWSEDVEGRQRSKDVSVDGRIILKLVLKKRCGELWSRFIWLIRPTRECYERSNLSLGFINGGEFLD